MKNVNDTNCRNSIANNYTIEELKDALSKYKPRPEVKREKNGRYKGGKGELYTRVRIGKKKVRMSHIIWRITNNKEIPSGCNIHHLNEDKREDRIENLDLVEVVPHMQLHYGKKHNIIYKKKNWFEKMWDYLKKILGVKK